MLFFYSYYNENICLRILHADVVDELNSLLKNFCNILNMFAPQEQNGRSNDDQHSIDDHETVIKQLRDENSSLKER